MPCAQWFCGCFCLPPAADFAACAFMCCFVCAFSALPPLPLAGLRPLCAVQACVSSIDLPNVDGVFFLPACSTHFLSMSLFFVLRRASTRSEMPLSCHGIAIPPPTPCASFEYFVMCSIAHLCADVSNNISLQPQAGEKHPVAEPVRAFQACSGPALQTASGPWQCRPWRCTPNQFSAMHSLCHFAIRSKLTGGCHCMGYPAEFYVVCPQFGVALHYFCMLCEMHT